MKKKTCQPGSNTVHTNDCQRQKFFVILCKKGSFPNFTGTVPCGREQPKLHTSIMSHYYHSPTVSDCSCSGCSIYQEWRDTLTTCFALAAAKQTEPWDWFWCCRLHAHQGEGGMIDSLWDWPTQYHKPISAQTPVLVSINGYLNIFDIFRTNVLFFTNADQYLHLLHTHDVQKLRYML